MWNRKLSLRFYLLTHFGCYRRFEIKLNFDLTLSVSHSLALSLSLSSSLSLLIISIRSSFFSFFPSFYHILKKKYHVNNREYIAYAWSANMHTYTTKKTNKKDIKTEKKLYLTYAFYFSIRFAIKWSKNKCKKSKLHLIFIYLSLNFVFFFFFETIIKNSILTNFNMQQSNNAWLKDINGAWNIPFWNGKIWILIANEKRKSFGFYNSQSICYYIFFFIIIFCYFAFVIRRKSIFIFFLLFIYYLWQTEKNLFQKC